ncbi:MAG: histidine phosphatase family protein [Pseudonocardia sp.]|uniref:histidine phosphatase family protein n=1 Tax=Pseudonocardia sp. TaxID=60912 RepID=UPI001AC13981|nr:histidine phosphatase family protein [Pseudonocardia sp.]MBN9098560.1 histidine phosphatase family protein [Pseudonocardia sp.]
MSLVAVRHAETAWNRYRIFMGGLDVEPDPAALARIVPGPTADRVYASPLRRAALTAAALFPGADVIIDDRLRERAMGEWEGRPKDDVRRERPADFPGGHLDVTVTPPGGEELDALVARVGGFLAEVPPDEHVVVVSHNGWIRTAQYLAGEATLADFHAHPVPQLVPTPLAVGDQRIVVLSSSGASKARR